MTVLLANVMLVAALLGATVTTGLRWHAAHVGYGTRRSAVVSTVAVAVCAVAVFVFPALAGWARVWLVGLVLLSLAVTVGAMVADRPVFLAWLERLRHGGPEAGR